MTKLLMGKISFEREKPKGKCKVMELRKQDCSQTLGRKLLAPRSKPKVLRLVLSRCIGLPQKMQPQ